MKYMFYESSRIVEKQEKYEKIRAYRVIDSLEKNGLSLEKMMLAVDVLLTETALDFDKAVLSKAKNILEVRKERNETSSINDCVGLGSELRT